MKTLVLSTLISLAALGNSFAGPRNEPLSDKNDLKALKETMAFHEHNMEILYKQYDMAQARIQSSIGNHAELERDHQFFVKVYQQDIDKGIRIEQSKKAIEEIDARYVKLHAERNIYEEKKIARLQKQLKVALKKEAREFDKAKKALSVTIRNAS